MKLWLMLFQEYCLLLLQSIFCVLRSGLCLIYKKKRYIKRGGEERKNKCPRSFCSLNDEELSQLISESASRQQKPTSHQSGSAGPPAHGGRHRADGADGRAAGAVGQRGHPHGHPLALLGLGRAGGGEADADHLVDGSEQAELGKALKVSERG